MESYRMDIVSPHAQQGKLHYVYTLAYPESMGGSVFYVGKGANGRINDHESEARRSKRSDHKLNTIRKIWASGEEIVKTKLAYFDTSDEALQYEIALIFFMDGLTNLTRGGDGIVGLVRTKEHQRKISEALTGKKAPPEVRMKLSEAHKRSTRNAEHLRQVNEAKKGKPGWNKGKPQSEEHRRHNSEARKGIPRGPRPEEAVRKTAEANRGKKRSEETCRKISEARKGVPRGPFSEEHKRKLREARAKQIIPPRSPEAIRKFSETMRGHPVSEETRLKLSNANKGKQMHSEEARRKMSETRKGHPGKPRSEEARRRMSEAQQRRPPRSAETRRKISEAGKGRVPSEETKRKRSESMKKTLEEKRCNANNGK